MIDTLLGDARVRFLIAGGSAALLNWVVRFPLSLVLPYSIAVLVSLAIGMTYGFVIYRNWAFRSDHRRGLGAEIRDFLLVNAGGIAVTLGVSVLMERALGLAGLPVAIGEASAHAIGIGFGAVVNYLGHRYFTFR